ncbi:hypothetical protein [Shimia sp. Alg240-R146]|uniref:hypothetical protein n=1 Tax=Shimia sp. Alg240-R146 TaxID=2993449 RepID=UPI0022E7A60E|nr:hypothetical protein [Shimia sp. Alg240-R146]
MEDTLYVAETDEFGELACVWVRPKGAKSARVFNPSKDSYDPQKAANFSGSAAANIIGWLKAQSE